ncbi:MAG: C39 family peptidase [Candidatus Tyrphobacter sp.]
MRALLTVAVLAAAFAAAAGRGDAQFAGYLPGAGMVRIPIVSMRGEQFLGIVRQHTDYSCGAASVATILKYGYDIAGASEDSVIDGMLKVSNPAVVRQRGFSLLDIKNYVDALGLSGSGFKISYALLQKIRVPTVILLNESGYLHFVVFRKATAEYTWVADPIRGNQRFRADVFAGMWDGIIFVIAPGPNHAIVYDRTNVLANVPAPVGMEQMANGIPPIAYMLNSVLLETIYIPGIDRL